MLTPSSSPFDPTRRHVASQLGEEFLQQLATMIMINTPIFNDKLDTSDGVSAGLSGNV